MDPVEKAERTDPAEATEAIEPTLKADAIEPALATERIEPTLANDRRLHGEPASTAGAVHMRASSHRSRASA